MIVRFSRIALVALLLVGAVRIPASATMEADPGVLYAQMKAAYDKAQTNSWDFYDQKAYFSTILNAGRAYSLQRPNDPAYAELATLTVQMGSGLHYNPLTNHDAAVWYVREAADYTVKNSTDAALVQSAKDLLERVNSEDDPQALARLADEDAQANAGMYRGDVEAGLETVEADWRGWLLTNDPSWRSQAFQRAASPTFPIAHLPTTYGPELLRSVQGANSGGSGFTDGDRANAKIILERIQHLVSPLVIASVTSMPHDAYLTTLAPADEYFGKMGYSVLGIENELKRINVYLDYKYGDREASATVLVADAIDDMHKVYPRDRDMPKLLYSCLQTLQRMDSDDTKTAAAHLQGILIVEYQDSPEARKVLTPATPSS